MVKNKLTVREVSEMINMGERMVSQMCQDKTFASAEKSDVNGRSTWLISRNDPAILERTDTISAPRLAEFLACSRDSIARWCDAGFFPTSQKLKTGARGQWAIKNNDPVAKRAREHIEQGGKLTTRIMAEFSEDYEARVQPKYVVTQ